MSIAKLTKAERATYFVGKAIADTMTRIEKSKSRDMEQAKSIIICFVLANSSDEALSAIRETFGWLRRFEEFARNAVDTVRKRGKRELN